MTGLSRRIADLERGAPAVSKRTREELWAEGQRALAGLHATFHDELGDFELTCLRNRDGSAAGRRWSPMGVRPPTP